jgi:hypothetical protein
MNPDRQKPDNLIRQPFVAAATKGCQLIGNETLTAMGLG